MTPDVSLPSPIHPFLSGGGEMARLIAAHDWAATSMGPIETWPQSIQTTVAMMLRSPVPIVALWGEDGVMIYNDAYSVFAGRRHPRLLGSKVREGWPEIAAFNDNVMKVGLAGGTLAYQDQELILHRRGAPEPVWMNLYYSPLLAEDGRPAGVIAVVIETTDKVEAERRLRVAAEALARLNGELEQRVAERTAERDRMWRYSRDLLTVVDADGIFRAANPAWATVLGLAPDEVVGRSFREIIWPEDEPLAAARHGEALAAHDLRQFEIRFRHRDGTPRWISWNTSVEGGEVFAFGRDITGERAQAEALRQAEEALRHAQKMEAVGQLTGGIAHDFNNLLTAISGSLELLGTRIQQGRLPETDRYIQAAQGAATRAASLVHRLLAFSRRQTLDPLPTDVSHLVEGLAELIRRTVGPGITLKLGLASDLWPTLIDQNQMESALLNLCINARDAMPQGGLITIETENRRLDAAAAKARDMAPGEYVAIAVADTGTGMAPEVAARAFDPFFTTKPLGQGTGLGLSMIYGFIRQSGGQVRIRSAPGRGTTVCLYLPRHQGLAAPAAGAPPLPDPAALSARARPGQTVLVVDDEGTVRGLVAEVLGELGYAALEAIDAAGALAVLRGGARVDLLVTDVGLPGMNGRQLAEAARCLRPGLPVLFITGYAENAAFGGAPLAPGLHVLTKPFALEALAGRIRSILEQRPGTW